MEPVAQYDRPTENKRDLIKATQNQVEGYRNMREHIISLQELAAQYFVKLIRLETSLSEGLTDDQAIAKNRQFGDNKLTEKTKTPWYVKLIMEML